MAVLYHSNCAGRRKENIYDYDRSLAYYISNFKEEEYGKILYSDNRFEVFYHLSEIRRGILNWYPFNSEKSLLEIGGEYGALTGLFCEKCAEVVVTEISAFKADCIASRYASCNHLKVYEGKPDRLGKDKKFDYIVWIGGLEWCLNGKKSITSYAEYLKKILDYLKPDGRLILAVENRYGLRYFCGDVDPHTGRSFDGIKGYPYGTAGYSFAAHELDAILETAGLTKRKFYYPLPDYHFPQVIYSQNYLPRPGLAERIRPFYYDSRQILFSENLLYDDLAENGVFSFFANSFLVECGIEDMLCGIDYCTITMDRVRTHSSITCIYDNHTVHKSACSAKGKRNIVNIYQNLEELSKRGIRTVPHSLKDDMLVMPFIEADLLSVWIRKNMEEGAKWIKQAFQKLYSYILQSSEHIDPSQNSFLNDQNSFLDWGPILKKAYIEMIPLNCFYSDQDLVFFDQEFVQDCYPAKYVIFRALRNTYDFIPGLEALLPLQEMKEEYGLNRLWDIFLEKDNQFLVSLRDMQSCQYYDKWIKNGRTYMEKYKIGYIAGVFDLFHIGHLNLINRAKERCEYLIVGVLTDELVVYYKHKLPCIPFEERMAVVEAIKAVDRVVPVTWENTGKMDSWRLYHFDCQFSGSDYENVENWMEDKKRLETVGSTIEFLPYTKTTSSTKINKLIQGRLSGKRLFIFGAGAYGREFLCWFEKQGLEEDWDLLGFLDNNIEKNYSLLERHIIYTPAYMETLEEYQEIMVVIAAKYQDDIAAQLQAMGIRNIISDADFQVKYIIK